MYLILIHESQVHLMYLYVIYSDVSTCQAAKCAEIEETVATNYMVSVSINNDLDISMKGM
jgi:hypothetical protein